MHISGPDIAVALGYRLISRVAQSARMLIEAYSRCVFPAGAVTPAAVDDQIATDVSRYRGVIPFWDGDLLENGLIQGSDPTMKRIPAELPADGKI